MFVENVAFEIYLHVFISEGKTTALSIGHGLYNERLYHSRTESAVKGGNASDNIKSRSCTPSFKIQASVFVMPYTCI